MNLDIARHPDEILRLALEAEGGKILAHALREKSGRAGKLLASEGGAAVVIIGLRCGVVIDRDRTAGSVCIDVLRGRVEVARGTPLCIGRGQSLLVPSQGSYALRATTETVLLLSSEVQRPTI